MEKLKKIDKKIKIAAGIIIILICMTGCALIYYFNGISAVSVKDEESTLPCVCFNPAIFQDVNEGDMVTLSGGPNFYTKSGRFNYIVYRIEPAGQGLLYQRFMELKNKLEQEGLFAAEHKKPMPKTIKRIGVVTSKEGAVIQDIKNVTWRRNPSVEIVLYPTKVQGVDADKEIVEGINFFSNYNNVDVVVVARGGGSMEDLSAYNTESVARATYNCKKPIVSAVGHETDFTIIDFVSDLRAPTPSAAAELLTIDTSKEREKFSYVLEKLQRYMLSYLSDKIVVFQDDINEISAKLEDYVYDRKKECDERVFYFGSCVGCSAALGAVDACFRFCGSLPRSCCIFG